MSSSSLLKTTKHLFYIAILCIMLALTTTVVNYVESRYRHHMPQLRTEHAGHLVPQAIFNGLSIRKTIITLIKKLAAQDSLWITAFMITDSYITKAIIDAHKRGVKVFFVADHESAYKPASTVKKIIKAGINVHLLKLDAKNSTDRPGIMHNKFIIIEPCNDTSVVLTGSYNFTHSAAEKNCENIVCIYDTPIIEDFKKEFLRLQRRSYKASPYNLSHKS